MKRFVYIESKFFEIEKEDLEGVSIVAITERSRGRPRKVWFNADFIGNVGLCLRKKQSKKTRMCPSVRL